jgi:quercetin dioxygenase-like cupin family protein
MRALRSTLALTGLLWLATAGDAPATPGSGVSDAVLATGTSPDGIAAESRGPTEVVVREITIAPGGSTGWHYHDGQVIAVVKSGSLTRTLSDCSTVVTRAGGSFVEPAGGDRVHIGRNLGAEAVVLLVTYVLPAGRKLAEDAPAPVCAR